MSWGPPFPAFAELLSSLYKSKKKQKGTTCTLSTYFFPLILLFIFQTLIHALVTELEDLENEMVYKKL